MIGPEDLWVHEMHKVSRRGLVRLIEALVKCGIFNPGRDELLRWAKDFRKVGRSMDLCASLDRYNDDPDAWLKRSIARSEAAKKAARRRKRDRKAAQKLKETK